MRGGGTKDVGRFTVPIEVANTGDVFKMREGQLDPDKVRRVTIQGWVDSGATKLILPKSVADQLGLQRSAKAKVRYADGRTATRQTAPGAHVTLLGREGDFTAIVEPKRSEALIGAIVLEDLDLLVDCQYQRLVPRDPNMALYEIE
jgi:predicted aspartyl protease